MSLGVIDLDGVNCDFITGSFVAHGRKIEPVTSWNYFTAWGITEKEFWAPIHEAGDDFYGSMVKPYPWLADLWRVIKMFTTDQIILTSPSNHPAGYSGKKIWCDKYLPGVKLVVAKDKQFLAGPRRVLVDDHDGNCATFKHPTEPLAFPGGESVLFPALWNANHGHSADPVKFVERRLRHLSRQ
jgi:hypothetical protein